MGKLNLQSLQERTFSALVMIPVVLFAVIWGGLPFFIMVGVLTAISLHEWFGMARKTNSFALYGLLGLIYVLIGFVCCALIREEYSFMAAVMFLVMVWAADIGAYFSGKIIGGPKMAPAISPNKTWAGLSGACGFAGLLGALCLVGNSFYNPEGVLSLSAMISVFVLGAFIGLVGQGGDLLVSMMKRKTGVKDTGSLIPGHGGLLDRVDGMLLAAPAFYVVFSALSLDF